MGSIPDVVTDEVNGLLVDPDDPAGLAAAVARLRQEPSLADRLAEAGRRRVERDFDETRAHRRLGAEIARLTVGRPVRPDPRGRGFRMVQRRRLGASWRRLRAAPPLAAAGVAGPCRRCARLPRHGPHAAVGRANRARDHRGGARAASTSLATLYELVPASHLHRAMLARRRGRPIPIAVTFDDDLASHLEVAAPSCGASRAPPRSSRPGRGSTERTDSGGSACRQRRTAASTHARRFARPPCAPAPSSRSPGLAAEVEQAPAAVRADAADALSQLIGEDPPRTA